MNLHVKYFDFATLLMFRLYQQCLQLTLYLHLHINSYCYNLNSLWINFEVHPLVNTVSLSHGLSYLMMYLHTYLFYLTLLFCMIVTKINHLELVWQIINIVFHLGYLYESNGQQRICIFFRLNGWRTFRGTDQSSRLMVVTKFWLFITSGAKTLKSSFPF
jgi:hypothetical protein